jgi:hypothetical protein
VFGRKLPKADVAGLRKTLPGERVLAWATTDGGHAVALTGHLALGAGDTWELIGWHDLVRGGWDPKAGILHWQPAQGERRSVRLADPRDLPPLFRERLNDTILVEERLGGPADGVVVTVQRRLDEAQAPLIFRATPVDADNPPSAELSAAADRRLDDFRRDLL